MDDTGSEWPTNMHLDEEIQLTQDLMQPLGGGTWDMERLQSTMMLFGT